MKILDTTLRDGSYMIDFNFTAQDTASIAALLDANNIPFIELGHGLGLNATSNPKMQATCNDDEYLEAAGSAIKKAKWGMFFIPGIGRIDDIDRAARYGMKFIRIGTNVTEVDKSEPFIRRAKELGLYVSSNFMKTYALSPDDVGRLAAQASSYGTDIVCVVDSAGGMFPEDVDQYFRAIRSHTDIPIGFHGHNNLGLVMANTLRAVELGAEIVDTSLRGIGRSAGNASTEILVLMLKKKNIETGIDPLQLMDIAEQKIDPLLINYKQMDSIGIVSGYAQFHSSYLGAVLRYSEQYGADPREVIIEVCNQDRVNAPDPLIESIAKDAARRKTIPQRVTLPLVAKRAIDAVDGDVAKRAEAVAREARTIAKKYGKKSVFNLVQSFRDPNATFVSPAVYDGQQFIMASAEIADAGLAKAVAESIDGIVDIIFVDQDMKSAGSVPFITSIRKAVNKSIPLFYSDLQAWAKSISALVKEKIFDFSESNVLIIGENQLAQLCRTDLSLSGISVSSRLAANKKADVVIYCDAVRDRSGLESLKQQGVIVDGLIGALPDDIVRLAHTNDFFICRPDMRIIVHNEIASALGVRTLVHSVQGKSSMNGVAIAAGGVLAPRGTVIVDSVSLPSRVYGIADGRGFLLPSQDMTPEMKTQIAVVERSIL